MPRSQFEEHWRRRFTERGQALDHDAGIAGWSESGLETRIRAFKRLWSGAPAGSRWIDIGCGAGSYSRMLADEGLNVIGVDYSQPSVAKAARRSPTVAGWVVGDVTRLPLAPQSVDGILCFGVLQALSSSDRALAEMTATIKPGGVLWVDALNAHCAPHLLKKLLRRPANLRYETTGALRCQLEQAGFTVETHWIPIAPGSLQTLQPLLESAPVRAVLKLIPSLGALLSHSVLVVARKP